MKRVLAFWFAMVVAVGLCVVSVVVDSVLIAWCLGFLAGTVLVLANVLTHPLLFGWRE